MHISWQNTFDGVLIVILAGGDVRVTAALKTKLQSSSKRVVIAADSGLFYADELGFSEYDIDEIVGDFDSVSEDLLAEYANVPQINYPPEKDLLDLELALEAGFNCAKLLYSHDEKIEVVIVGGLGSRFDQSLSALFLVAKKVSQGMRIYLDGGLQQAYVVVGTAEEEGWLKLSDLQLGREFSLLSLKERAQVSLQGAGYPMQKGWLEFGEGLGISNYVSHQPLQVTVHEGTVAVLIENPAVL